MAAMTLDSMLLLLSGAILASPCAMRAQAGGVADIRGRISVSARTVPPHAIQLPSDRERYDMHSGHESVRMADSAATSPAALSERAVVYVENTDLDRGTYQPPSAHPTLDQRNLEFHPRVLPILVGTTVDFPNRDNLYHNVFSYSEPKEFDLGRYPKDDSRIVTFDRPGLVRVYCDIHSHMNATIIVLRHPYFAVPDNEGFYTIPRVPEGKYTLVLWYDRDVVERRPIEVKGGIAVRTDFTL